MSKKNRPIHVSTIIGSFLVALGVVSYVGIHEVVGMALVIVGYFASIKEVSKYTSWYQFSMVFGSSIMLGLMLDKPLTDIPWLTVALLFASIGSILRIVMFTVFSYTRHPWLEPLMLMLSFAAYAICNYLYASGLLGWTMPAPIILFQVILTYGVLKDGKQLLTATRGGYKVQIGKPAPAFSLPDEVNTIVNLSDFKGKRHLLLVFVRGDWCPGCHMMLRTYEKNREKFQQKNIFVMAIGPDPVGVNKGMVEKLGIEFKVLADEGQRTAVEYGVQLAEYDHDFAEKYEEGIPLPASFLVDINGIVRYVSRPDRVGEFLNPALIFPIIESLK